MQADQLSSILRLCVQKLDAVACTNNPSTPLGRWVVKTGVLPGSTWAN